MTAATTSKVEKRPSKSSLTQQVLAHSQSSREVIQDYCALAESLEWELGQQYFRERGNKAFIGDTIPVPFLINNDGTLSRNAAEVFFTSCVEAEKAGEWKTAAPSPLTPLPRGGGEGNADVGQSPFSPDIFVLEIGIGVGLFARFFLDHFRDLCREHKKDFYDRLCYIAADRSERMLHDLLRHGVLREHAGHYRVRVVDALEPEKNLRRDAMFNVAISLREMKAGSEAEGEASQSIAEGTGESAGQAATPHAEREGYLFRAVFLNYLLDCLPAAVLEFKDDQVNQLCVRTCLARNIKLAEHTDMSAEALRQRAKVCSGNGDRPSKPSGSVPVSDKDDRPSKPSGSVPVSEKARDELMEVYHLFASEYDYRAANPKQIPYGDFAVDFGKRHGKRLMHNYGAIQCVERLLDLVHPSGFILMNEYGMNKVGRDDEYEHQRFSMATAVGLNFPLLMAYFEESKTGSDPRSQAGQTPFSHRLRWAVPVAGESRGIETRLLGHQPADETVIKFHELFSRHVQKELEEPVQQARASLQAGRFEMAANFYQKALEKQPRNWFLMGEISAFLTFQMRDPKAGIDMAKLALAQNPTCSAELWNTLGDGLYECGRTAEARSAYLKALAVNPSDVRARHNLVWVYTRERNYEKALQMVGEALAHDKTGQLRERLLHKQNEILALAARQHQQEYLLYVNFVSRDSKKQLGTAANPPTEPSLSVATLAAMSSIEWPSMLANVTNKDPRGPYPNVNSFPGFFF